LERTRTFFITAAVAACLSLSCCFSGSEDQALDIRETAVSDHSVGLNYSLNLDADRMTVIYPALDALSLNLISAELDPDPLQPNIVETKYLDRISYSPDIDETFGQHLYLSDSGYHHVLYIDREDQENAVLKWLTRTDPDDSWWIDAFPGLSRPLSAIPESDGALRIVTSGEDSLFLYRLLPGGQPELLASTAGSAPPIRVSGRVHAVLQGDSWSFSAYDQLSERLYLVHPRQSVFRIEPVYGSAEVHYTTIVDNRLLILLFDPVESTITLLERGVDQSSFEATPVTLSEDTHSVFLTSFNGNRLFLFDERIVERQQELLYQLSLLYPDPESGNYEKAVLLKGEEMIQSFTAGRTGDVLYVLYLREEKLTLLSLSLTSLKSGSARRDTR
jgi:hypothetical protein